MPTYQYACTECGDRLDVVQRFSDEPLTVCVSCGGRLRKVFSAVGIVFKGSGFYRTDSRAGSARPSASNGKGDADGSTSGSDSGAATKADGGSTSEGASAGGTTASNGSSEGQGKAAKSQTGAKADKTGSSGASSKVA